MLSYYYRLNDRLNHRLNDRLNYQLYCRLSRKVLYIGALCLLSQTTLAGVYPLDINKELNGLKIVADTTRIDIGTVVVLKLTNYDQLKAVCRITFDPRIASRKTYKREIESGTTASVKYSPGRKPNRLTIDIICNPA
ncbi:MAG: hypothetical protein DRR42_08725 [Gammaproteobacteria bacterium]|nr:MAG: hypothetical protein DRR42_08725 [Gammaproteobacteria bacterium]